jgi:hypothetical protein
VPPFEPVQVPPPTGRSANAIVAIDTANSARDAVRTALRLNARIRFFRIEFIIFFRLSQCYLQNLLILHFFG